MTKMDKLSKIVQLFENNKILINSVIGYLKHDINKTEEMENTILALEKINYYEQEIKMLIEQLTVNDH